MNSSLRELKSSLKLLKDVPLAPYTTWKVGGAARWFAEPTPDEVPALVAWAREKDVPVYFLGRGSNILISDAGIPGLVISTRNSMAELYRDEDQIVAGSGVFLPRLSKFAAKEGFAGFEFLIGIPGTVGGALAVNAGLTVFRPREMVSIVKNFDVLNLDGSIETLTMKDICVSYRKTSLLDGKRMVLRVRFYLHDEDDPDKISRDTFEHLSERKRKQPLDRPTAGSTFKSPSGGKGAGWYIEQSGLKGFCIGGARVSPVHANWIENANGEATATDIKALMTYVQATVKDYCGTWLEPEIISMG